MWKGSEYFPNELYAAFTVNLVSERRNIALFGFTSTPVTEVKGMRLQEFNHFNLAVED
jgi:hypothetical protein